MSVITGKLVIRKKQIDSVNLFLKLYAIMPLVDSLNGYIILQLNKSLSVGQLYRLVLIALMLGIVFSGGCSKKYIRVTANIFLVYIVLLLFHIVVNNSLGAEASLIMQWLLTPLFLFGFMEMKRKNQIDKLDIEKLFDIYAWMVPLTIIIPKILGTGFNTYGGEIGYKGFYYANNGVSFLTAVLVIFSFSKLFDKITISRSIQIGLLVITCLMIGTKSSIIAVFIAVVCAVILSFRKSRFKGFLTSIFLLLTFALVYIRFQGYISLKVNEVLERYYYMSTVYKENIFDLLTTGRTIKVELLWDLMKNASIFPLNMLTGMGSIDIVAEMDFLDLFFAYGFIGIFAAACYSVVSIRKLTFSNGIYKVLLLFSLAYSFVVGHVFNNSMSTMILVLILASTNQKKEHV